MTSPIATEANIGTAADARSASGSALRRWAVVIFVTFAVGLLVGLGVWQLFRREAKLALIARVEARVHAAPQPVPPPAAWPHVDAADDEYRHVRATGRYRPVLPALVQAVTERGGGFWVLQPLEISDGATVLVNRGFVPADSRDAARRAPPPAGAVTVTGLLRLPEPGGAFLRTNDPAADRWFSRDVAAIAASRGLGDVAPFFIDAEGTDGPNAPVGGLTVVAFHNSHLVYAITWFSLAAMLAGWMVFARRSAPSRP